MRFKIHNRRYTGSKEKLKDWILSIIEDYCQGDKFADVFAGTGAIASEASKRYRKLIINDFLYSNYVTYKAFFGNSNWNKKKALSLIDTYNSVDSSKLENNYFSKSYGGKYFHNNDAKKIGYIRNDLEKKRVSLNDKEFSILLTSLLYSVDRIANTVGHYDAYIQKKPEEKKLIINLIEPFKVGRADIYRRDANKLVREIASDIIYIDPPYNSRQYSRFYHVLENLVKWDKPKLFGVARKPDPENVSDYCKVKAPERFKDLIDNINAKYIAVSYNNTYKSRSNSSRNKITLKQIKDILSSKGKTLTFDKDYRHFNSGKTSFDNHKEYLFLTKVGQ